jgi:glycogen synthase
LIADRGGIQTHVFNLSKALAAKGVEVHLFIIGEKSPLSIDSQIL